MARTLKSWTFWLGLFILAWSTFQVFTATSYFPLGEGRYFVHMNTSQIVTGIVFFLAGLYLTHSGRNRPGSLGESILV